MLHVRPSVSSWWMKQVTCLVDVQGNDIPADLWLRCHHGRLLHLFPVGPQVGQPEVVVNKLKTAQTITQIYKWRFGLTFSIYLFIYPFHAHRSKTMKPWSSKVLMWWNMPMAAPLNLRSMYSPGSFLAMWNKVYKKINIIRFHCKLMTTLREQANKKTTTILLLLGSHWTQSSPCSWSLGCSMHPGISGGWFSLGSRQTQCSFLTCQS